MNCTWIFLKTPWLCFSFYQKQSCVACRYKHEEFKSQRRKQTIPAFSFPVAWAILCPFSSTAMHFLDCELCASSTSSLPDPWFPATREQQGGQGGWGSGAAWLGTACTTHSESPETEILLFAVSHVLQAQSVPSLHLASVAVTQWGPITGKPELTLDKGTQTLQHSCHCFTCSSTPTCLIMLLACPKELLQPIQECTFWSPHTEVSEQPNCSSFCGPTTDTVVN